MHPSNLSFLRMHQIAFLFNFKDLASEQALAPGSLKISYGTTSPTYGTSSKSQKGKIELPFGIRCGCPKMDLACLLRSWSIPSWLVATSCQYTTCGNLVVKLQFVLIVLGLFVVYLIFFVFYIFVKLVCGARYRAAVADGAKTGAVF